MECISLVNKEDCRDASAYMLRRRTGKARMGEGDVFTTSGSTEKVSSRISSEGDDEDDGEDEGEGGGTTDLLTSSSCRLDNQQKGTSVTRQPETIEPRNVPEICIGCGTNIGKPSWQSETVPGGIIISGKIRTKTLKWSICLGTLFLVMALLRLYQRCFACCTL